MAWQHISPEVNVKAFRKCCMSSALYGTDGGMLWEGSGNDVDVRSECEEDEGSDCQDGDSERKTFFSRGFIFGVCLMLG
jgi:hypothetical protein